MTSMAPSGSPADLYDALGLQRGATGLAVRRAYRNLLTRAHPDKGGDPERFKLIQQAYDVLSDPAKRSLYDSTGRVVKTPDQEFVEAFAGGAFRDPVLSATANELAGGGGGANGGGSMADQIILRAAAGEGSSHTAGFEAWMRARGEAAGPKIFTAETVAEQYGVAAQSYDAVPLPPATAFQVLCRGPGAPSDTLALESVPLPAALEWGQVLVHMRYASISPADTYSARLGGLYGSEAAPRLPYVAGHDGVGVVAKVGPGCRTLAEGDLVMPSKPFAGTWASAAVWPERSLTKLPQDGYGLPLEYLALSRELALAYRLLEGGGLKPGDAVILNAANSCVGQVLLQLARMLRLRPVAVVRRPAAAASALAGNKEQQDVAEEGAEGGDGAWGRLVARLRGLGAAEVLADEGSLRLELDKRRFFARPRLALDAVGGDSGLRLAEALGEGGELVVYGCMSGRSPAWPWQQWVFRGLRVRGINMRSWAAEQPGRLAGVLAALGRLVAAGLLRVDVTEYDMTELKEALEHSQDAGKGTKVMLRMSEPEPTAAAAPAVAAAGAAAKAKQQEEAEEAPGAVEEVAARLESGLGLGFEGKRARGGPMRPVVVTHAVV